MNAPLKFAAPFGDLLKARYDHHGLTLDLYGCLDEDGYRVEHVCIPGTTIVMNECVDSDLMSLMSAYLDDTLPTAKELRRESLAQARIDRIVGDRELLRSFGAEF